ncbi:hypothetical protein CEQ90_07800 [Lewinellaceae bacterium SD302]|nr:hypothetical protein CEQ90_07800 [Lewinellaceae bacterium SD302]
MKNFILLTVITLMGFGLNAQSLDSPAGRWKTIDDETGEAKSVIEIKGANGEFTGHIAEILTGNDDAVCEKCSGKQKNAPMLGLVIIKDLKAKDDHWAGGSIMDPQKGAEYKLSVWYEDDNPDVLFVRGKHWTGLYRTQEWQRAE